MVKRNRGYKFAAEVADGVENDVLTVAETTHWDPVETAATRPLAFVDHSGDVPVTYFYTHDLTKNICEVLDVSGAIVTAYDYTPFGTVTASNTATPNTVTFSSEVLDAETALVYYNYRHYNPADGRWINRDPIGDVKKVKKTSPIRDVVWYEKMERRVGTEDIYSVLNYNCRKYSQKEFFYA